MSVFASSSNCNIIFNIVNILMVQDIEDYDLLSLPVIGHKLRVNLDCSLQWRDYEFYLGHSKLSFYLGR